MSEFLDRVEQRRLDAGLTQAAAAQSLGITQPHYSKVVGGVAALTPGLEERLRIWLEKDLPVGQDLARRRDERARIKELSRSIQRNVRELNALVGSRRMPPARRGGRRK